VAPRNVSHKPGSFRDAEVVAIRVKHPEVAQTPGAFGEILFQGPSGSLHTGVFLGEVVHLQDDFHASGGLAMTPTYPSGSSGSSDADGVSPQGYVGLRLSSLVANQFEGKHMGVEVGSYIQICGKDLESRAHRHCEPPSVVSNAGCKGDGRQGIPLKP
jgi:hypothetical protein